MIYIHKILPLIVSPLFLILILFIFGLTINSKKISLSAIILLILCSLPIISNKLKAYIETEFELLDVDNAESADAIVVLSGMVKTIRSKNKLNYEWGEAVDRIFAGVELMKAKTRKREVVEARQIAMFLAKKHTDLSLKAIGFHFGKRDHSTVIHAITTVNDMMDTDRKFNATMQEIIGEFTKKAS